MNLHSAGHRRGVAAAPHGAAAEAGRQIFAEGGNALEAMVAMAATIAAVYPHMNHVGGDGFWLVREPSGRMRAIMAAGPAGARARPELYRELGHDAIPPRGPLAALTVPGAIGGWMLALEAARAHGGRMPLEVLLGSCDPPCARRLCGHPKPGAADQRETRRAERRAGICRGFPDRWQAARRGATLTQTAFAATLEQLPHAGLDDFYRGDVGREIAADLEKIGSPVTRSDLERYRARVEPNLYR